MKSHSSAVDQGERSDTFLSALLLGECHKEMSMCVYIYGVIFVKTYNIPPLFDILTIRPSFPSYYWHNEAFFWPQAPTVTSLTSLCVRVPESISIYLGKYLVFLLKCVCCSESKGLSLFWAMKGGVLC